MSQGSKIPRYFLRRFSQIVCFFLFIFLFIKTDYSGSDEIAYAVNILFRIDPLLAATTLLASKVFIALMLPALLTLILTFILGRFFCGWVCPMGALLDSCHKVIPPVGNTEGRYHSLKYYILAFLFIGAWFGLPVAGYFDPFSILVRGLTLAVYPAFNALNTTFFTFTYQQAPDWLNSITEPVYSFMKYTLLPFNQKYYDLALFSFFILMLVFVVEIIERRFFCRNICPLGAMLAVTSRFSLLKGIGGTRCGKCRNCRDICRMAAIDNDRNISAADCNLCLDCVEYCPGRKISFRFGGKKEPQTPLDLSRRGLAFSIAAGAVLPFFMKSRSMASQPDPFLIRPPGALKEEDFLGRCVRCGECMKVCIGNGLHPTFLDAGIEGIFSPKLLGRIGYCEFNCTLCGQVCPTGAIMKLELPEKQKTKIGHAWFDKSRCLPYASATPCIVCEEHCPTPDKAIKFREAEVLDDKGEIKVLKQPYLVDELCIGCGICETKCPLPGRSAVRVTSAGETRNPDHAIPTTGITGYFGA